MRGYNLVALIFAREVSDPLVSLIKAIDKQMDEGSGGRTTNGRKLGVFVIFCNDGALLKPQLKYLAGREKLKHIVFCASSAAGPARYRVAKEADVTAVVYTNRRRVQTNVALRKDGLTEARAKEITEALARVLPAKPVLVGPPAP